VVVGHKLADVPMILVGIDPCFSCNDRSITLRRRGSARHAEGADSRRAGSADSLESWSWEDLRAYGISYYARGGT